LPTISIPDGAVDFDSKRHLYFVNQVRFPSVTEILEDLGLAPSFNGVDPFYASRGKAVHLSIALHLSNDLEVESIERRHVLPRYLQWKRWWYKQRPKQVIFCEKPLASVYGYAGTPDLVYLNEDDVICIPDWKSGQYHKHHHLQLGGYGGLVQEQKSLSKPDLSARFKMTLVYLDGTTNDPKEVEVEPANIETFRAAARIYSWKNKKRA
jgi:hypothetical protein